VLLFLEQENRFVTKNILFFSDQHIKLKQALSFAICPACSLFRTVIPDSTLAE